MGKKGKDELGVAKIKAYNFWRTPPSVLHVLSQELAVCSIRNQQEAFSSSSETPPEVEIPTQKLDGTTVNLRLAIFNGCSLHQH